MNVVPIKFSFEFTSAPFIAFVDLQVEHIAKERAYSIQNLDPWISNCKRLLDGVRRLRLPLAHFRQLRSSAFFNKNSDFSQWIEDFRPTANEAIYERQLPSCYSNSSFSDYMNQISQPVMILAGLTADQSCLSTAVEAYHRGHRIIYVSDASSNPVVGSLSEEKSHNIVSHIISLYAKIVTTEEILMKLQSMDLMTLRRYQ